MAIAKSQVTIFRCCFCQQLMTDGRSDKKTCSTACRVKLHRWKKRIDDLEVKADSIITEFQEYLKFYDAVPRAVKALETIKTKSDAVLRQANIQGVS